MYVCANHVGGGVGRSEQFGVVEDSRTHACMHAMYAAAHTDGMCVRVGRGGVCGGDEGLRGRQRM